MPLAGATNGTFMEQERNPNKNAELSMEQNGNMIDIINNPAPPPAEKPLDKVQEHPPKRRSQGVRALTSGGALSHLHDGDAGGTGIDR